MNAENLTRLSVVVLQQIRNGTNIIKQAQEDLAINKDRAMNIQQAIRVKIGVHREEVASTMTAPFFSCHYTKLQVNTFTVNYFSTEDEWVKKISPFIQSIHFVRNMLNERGTERMSEIKSHTFKCGLNWLIHRSHWRHRSAMLYLIPSRTQTIMIYRTEATEEL